MPEIHYVNTVAAAEKTVRSILCLRTPIVGVVCKGINVGKKGTITAIAVSTWDGDVYIYDVKKRPNIVLDGGIIRLLQSVELVKVIHDCSYASANLKFGYGITLKNYFDSQVAFSVILESQGLPPRNISFDGLCERYKIDRYEASAEMKAQIHDDVNFWGLRPLTKAMMNVMAAEVLPLVPNIYCLLQRQMGEHMYEWFDCRSEENRLLYISRQKVNQVKCRRWQKKMTDRKHMFRAEEQLMSRANVPLIRNTVPDTQHQINPIQEE